MACPSDMTTRRPTPTPTPPRADAGAVAAVVRGRTRHTAPLPPPAAWPPALKRLLARTLTRWGATWDIYAAPWGSRPVGQTEAAWDLLRMTARALTPQPHRLLDNDEAWTVCIGRLGSAGERVDGAA